MIRKYDEDYIKYILMWMNMDFGFQENNFGSLLGY